MTYVILESTPCGSVSVRSMARLHKESVVRCKLRNPVPGGCSGDLTLRVRRDSNLDSKIW
jgi:hypothetical protein